jgi:hypothetical protein
MASCMMCSGRGRSRTRWVLCVNVPPEAAIRLLESDAAGIAVLLKQIPVGCDIVDVDPGVLSSESAAGRLCDLLRSGKDGLGWTTTSKLMAAKRPRLILIWDSFVEQATLVTLDCRDDSSESRCR